MVWRSPSARIGGSRAAFAACILVLGANAATAEDVAPSAADAPKIGATDVQKLTAPPPSAAVEDACVAVEPRNENAALAKALARWSTSPDYSHHSVDIYSPYRITPAGGQVSVDVDRGYADVTSPPPTKDVRGVKNLAIKAIFQLGRDPTPPGTSLFPSAPVAAEPIPDGDEFAKSVSLPIGSSRLRFDVPPELAKSWNPLNWSEGRLTVLGCDGDKLEFIGQRDTSYSGRLASLATTVVITAVIYIFTALGVRLYENSWRVNTRRVSWIRCLDPVVLSSGPNSAGSLARLQILFFSVLVFGILTFILLRVGLLTALSTTVLLLLGISAFGAAASKAADNQKERLSFDNWAWLIRKRWLPPHGIASVTTAKWADIVTGSDGFDIYHFQMLIFSLVVGFGLLKVGFTELATFEVPESLLALLGLSQAVYVTGKIVDQPTVQELDKALTDLRAAEDEFLKQAAGTKNFAEALSKANNQYLAYKHKRDEILPVLQSVFLNYTPRDEFFNDGVKNPTETLEPGYPYPDDITPRAAGTP